MAMNIEFRPTIVVGLGGTGATILTHLKAMLLDTVGDQVTNTIRLVALDTDNTLPEVTRRNGQLAKLNKFTEFINLGNVPTTTMMANLKGHETVAPWLPPRIPLPVIARGANMIRPLGRLAFFFHFTTIVRELESELRKARYLFGMDSRVGVAGQKLAGRELEVFLVTSLCGGTGAGTFIDMTYLMRHLCEEELFLESRGVFLNGVLVLPSAFPTVEAQTRLAANAKSCLDDLDYLTNTGFEETYPDGYHLEYPYVPPFNSCYLVEAVNRNNYVLEGLNGVAPMVATSIYLQIASRVGPITRSRAVNLDNLTKNFEGRPTVYSGMGCAKLVFPAERIIEQCARRFCRTFVDRKLLQYSVSQTVIDQQMVAFMRQHGLAPETLLAEMTKVRDRQPRIAVGINPQALAGAGIDQIVGRARHLVSSAERRLKDQFAPQMQINQEEAAARLTLALGMKVDELLNDSIYGLNATISFVERLERELLELGKSLNDAREQVANNFNADEQRSREAFQALSSAVTSRLPLWRNVQAGRAADDYVRSEDQRLRNLLMLHQYDAVLRLLAGLRQRAATLRLAHTELRGRLVALSQALSTQQGENLDLERLVDVLSWPVLGQQEADALYVRFLPGEDQWMNLVREHCRPFAEWRAWSQQEMEKNLLHFASQPFNGVASIKIEDFIREGADPDAAGNWIERIRNRAVPFWNWVEGKSASLRTAYIHVLGVPDYEKSIFRDFPQAGGEMVSTYDQRTIAMLSTEHGMSSQVLSSYREYERAYGQQVKEYGAYLRLFNPEMRARSAREFPASLRTFAIGQVLGYVTEGDDGVFFFQSPGQAQDQARPLSPDLELAIKKLGEQADMTAEIESAARKYRDEHGRSGADQRVQSYLASPRKQSVYFAKLREQLDEAAKAWVQ